MTVRRLRRNPLIPRRARIAIIVAGLWVASPIDLIPEFLPAIGPLDDVVVIALALRYAARQVPRDVLLAPGRLARPAPATRTAPGTRQTGRPTRRAVGWPDPRQVRRGWPV